MKKTSFILFVTILAVSIGWSLSLKNHATDLSAIWSEEAWAALNAQTDPDDLYARNQEYGLYFAPWNRYKEKRFRDVIGWRLKGRPEYTSEEESFLPKVIPDAKERIQDTQGDFIMWIGHNTFLIRLGDTYWITDPIFSHRALGPARFTEPGISLEDFNALVPKPHVVISHNHYDHLDSKSIKAMPEDTPVFVPMGLGEVVERMKKTNVHEMNWWDETSLEDGAYLVCLPAQHWSLRIGQRRNESLWASYMLIKGDTTIYLGGDSGYFVGYQEFGRVFDDIDYALIPTTAYHPRWFMHYQHLDIPEALMAFDELKAQYFIPTQWGTFHLGDEPPGYPALDLKRHVAKQKRDPTRFLIMDVGEIVPIEG